MRYTNPLTNLLTLILLKIMKLVGFNYHSVAQLAMAAARGGIGGTNLWARRPPARDDW